MEAACLCDLSLSLGNPILIYVPKSESGRLTSANAEMQQPSDIADSGITIHARILMKKLGSNWVLGLIHLAYHHMLSICLLKCHTHVGYEMVVLHFLILILATIWAFETMVVGILLAEELKG
ncbi:PREDICTED: LOC109948400 isoform X4 [Prunus dulcis]|uniref:PREDICTED: LOC109948400 isoform X4 n=1 Tax=Prunus dulcis TaxID=3755 RepID=A0A5E4GMA8_PRUDU|nr:PREDICTED: LOC109948400 isoform X4 [Prunus dulcis]